MEPGIDHGDVDHRQDLVDEISRDDGSEPTTSDGDGLDDDVRVSHKRLVPAQAECRCQLRVRRVIAVHEGEDAAGVDE